MGENMTFRKKSCPEPPYVNGRLVRTNCPNPLVELPAALNPELSVWSPNAPLVKVSPPKVAVVLNAHDASVAAKHPCVVPPNEIPA
jgi:hypothetical protein